MNDCSVRISDILAILANDCHHRDAVALTAETRRSEWGQISPDTIKLLIGECRINPDLMARTTDGFEAAQSQGCRSAIAFIVAFA